MDDERYPAWFCLIVMVTLSLGMWGLILEGLRYVAAN